jgi:hypothetical protein
VILKFWRTVSTRICAVLGPRLFLLSFVAVVLAGTGVFGVPRLSAQTVGSALNPGGRIPCYWVAGMTVPVSRCPALGLVGPNFSLDADGAAGNGLVVEVPEAINGNSYVAVTKLGAAGDNVELVAEGSCTPAGVGNGRRLVMTPVGGAIRLAVMFCGTSSPDGWSYFAYQTTLPTGTDFGVLQVQMGGPGERNAYWNGVSMAPFDMPDRDWLNTGPNVSLAPGPTLLTVGVAYPHFTTPNLRVKYVGIASGTGPLTVGETTALLAATGSPVVPVDPLNPGGRAPCYWVTGLVLPVGRCSSMALAGLSGSSGDPSAGRSGFVIASDAQVSWASTTHAAWVIRVPASGLRNTILLNCFVNCDYDGAEYLDVMNTGSGLALRRTWYGQGVLHSGGETCVIGSWPNGSDYFLLEAEWPINGSAYGASFSVDGAAFGSCGSPTGRFGVVNNGTSGNYVTSSWRIGVDSVSLGNGSSDAKMLYASFMNSTGFLTMNQASALKDAVLSRVNFPVVTTTTNPSTTTTTTTPGASSRWRSLFARLGGSNRCTAFGWNAGAAGGAVPPLPSVGGAPAGCPAFTSSVPGWSVQAEPESGEPGIGSIVGGAAYGATSYVSPNPWQAGHGYLVFKLPTGNSPATLSWATLLGATGPSGWLSTVLLRAETNGTFAFGGAYNPGGTGGITYLPELPCTRCTRGQWHVMSTSVVGSGLVISIDGVAQGTLDFSAAPAASLGVAGFCENHMVTGNFVIQIAACGHLTSPPPFVGSDWDASSDPLNPAGRAPCYWVTGLVLPVARCSSMSLADWGAPAAGSDAGRSIFTSASDAQVPWATTTHAAWVIRVPASGLRNTIMLNCFANCDYDGAEYLDFSNMGSGLAVGRTWYGQGVLHSSSASTCSLGAWPNPSDYFVLEAEWPANGTAYGASFSVDGTPLGSCGAPAGRFGVVNNGVTGTYVTSSWHVGVNSVSLGNGPSDAKIVYASFMNNPGFLTASQIAALKAAAIPTTIPVTTTTTSTTAVSSTSTTNPAITTSTLPAVLSGVLTASIVRGPNNAAGASTYTVSLKVTGATTGGQYEFVVPTGHVPEPVPVDRATHRYLKTAVNGEVVLQYTLVAPRGVFRAEVYSAGGSTPLSSVEVK